MLIRLEGQAVTAADLGEKHGILACLDFCLVLSLVEIPVDLCSSQVLRSAAVSVSRDVRLLSVFYRRHYCRS